MRIHEIHVYKLSVVHCLLNYVLGRAVDIFGSFLTLYSDTLPAEIFCT
jgi:hypothetical protein